MMSYVAIDGGAQIPRLLVLLPNSNSKAVSAKRDTPKTKNPARSRHPDDARLMLTAAARRFVYNVHRVFQLILGMTCHPHVRASCEGQE